MDRLMEQWVREVLYKETNLQLYFHMILMKETKGGIAKYLVWMQYNHRKATKKTNKHKNQTWKQPSNTDTKTTSDPNNVIEDL